MTNTANANAEVANLAAPFYERRGQTGVLMLHGYSGSPAELRPMGQALAAANYTVCTPLLAGHGGAPADLFGVTWEDWLASAEGGLRQLAADCETIAVCGFSIGGLLALHIAARRPLAAAVLLAPALHLRGGGLLRLAGVLQHIMPWHYPLARANFADPAVRAAVLERAPEANLDDPSEVEMIRRAAKVPVGSLFQLALLQREVRRLLPRITLPTLIMQGRLDQIVEPRSATVIAAAIRSRDRQLIWFEHSGHQLPLESEREAVWATAREWLDRLARPAL